MKSRRSDRARDRHADPVGPRPGKRGDPIVYGFGSAALDFRIRTADLGENYRDKLLAQETAVLGGGAVANALVQVSRLGGRSAWLGKLGCDWIGDRIVSGLEAESVSCGHVIRDGAHPSPFNVAVYAGEHRRRVGGYLLPGSLAVLSDEEVERLASVPGREDLLLIEVGEVPLEACLQMAARSRERGIRIALDIDLDPVAQCGASTRDADELLSAADFIIPNFQAMQTLMPGTQPDRMAAEVAGRYDATAIVSAGEMGAWYCEADGEPHHQPAIPIEVVDSVGAGDAFHGGILYGIAHGMEIRRAVDLGARCGSLNCRHTGAREGMATMHEVMEMTGADSQEE